MGKAAIKTRTLKIAPRADIGDFCAAGELVALNVGPDGVAYFAVAQKPLDYVRKNARGARFAKTVPTQPQRYRVVGLSDQKTELDVVIDGEQFDIHHVHPLPNGELLLACARSRYGGPDDFERNGRVYSRAGRFIREILLGDGIQAVQATPGGVVWTSYFDEGIFGNYGWQDPVGASGLIAWDSSGRKLYEFEPTGGLDSMCDCYALNVASESLVWCYYYTEFPLVRIRRRRIDRVWKCPVKGSDAFAVSDGYALFRGGYKGRDTYHLLTLEPNGRAMTIAKIEFQDEDGDKLIAERVVARGPSLYLLKSSRLYRIDVTTAANSIRL